MKRRPYWCTKPTRWGSNSFPYVNTFICSNKFAFWRVSENALIFIADLDECSEIMDACGSGKKCVNVQGGYSCECKQGYVKKDGVCVKGKLLMKESMICTLKELRDHRRTQACYSANMLFWNLLVCILDYSFHNSLHHGSLRAVASLVIIIAYGLVFPAKRVP